MGNDMKKSIFVLLVLVSANVFCSDGAPDSFSLDACLLSPWDSRPEVSVKSGLYWDIGDISLGPTLG